MFKWFRLFNLTDFENLGLVSAQFDVILEGIGQKTVLVTKGNVTSVLYEDVFLSINLNNTNPFRVGERAVFLDPNNDVWIGVFSAN